MARPALTAGRHRLRILVTVIPLCAMFVFGLSLLHRRAWRLDLTAGQRYTLSERARRVLGEAPPGTRVIAFLRTQDPRNMLLRDLLRQIEAVAPTCRTEVVDVNRVPALAREYGVRGVAFVLEANGRRRVVSNPAEDALVAGMLDLLGARTPRVGWVVGHGEGDPESGERRTGFAQLRRALELDHRDVHVVSLGERGLAPDLDVVIIVGPRGDYLPEDLAVLQGYLDRGGALLAMLDSGQAPRLAAFLDRYGVVLTDDQVLDPAARLYGGESRTIRLTLDQRTHPIVRALAAPPLFSRARSVRLRQDALGVEFLFAGASSFAVPRAVAESGAVVRYQPGRDRAGPVPVGVEAVSSVPGAPRDARVIVLGSAEFASNFFLEFLGNRDLVLNAIGWLVRDEAGVGHRFERQRPGVNQLFVSAEEGRRLFWLAVVAQPGIVLAIGVFLLLRRRWR